MMKMKGTRTTLLVAGLLLASASESAGALGLVMALLCMAAFALLLVLSLVGREERDAAEAGLPLTAFPHPLDSPGERAGAAERGLCTMPPGWMSTERPLAAPVPRRSCRAP
ncbi:MAG: hypothetical protein H5T73_06295 [Actinobacteria bacterium]|nr:hypothetical protein [Actinomycetota bacterium]